MEFFLLFPGRNAENMVFSIKAHLLEIWFFFLLLRLISSVHEMEFRFGDVNFLDGLSPPPSTFFLASSCEKYDPGAH
jgi:hypothetical protein